MNNNQIVNNNKNKIKTILLYLAKNKKIKKAPVFDAEAKTDSNPFKILVFTMLSARTKDGTTIRVVEKLFEKADKPDKVAALGVKKLEKILYGVGFYHVKARHLFELSKILSKTGKIPDSLEGMIELPGVGRKTANIALSRIFGKNTLGVDVHVHRISNRLGVVKTKKPEDTELELLKIIPKSSVRSLNRNFVALGQTICLPRNPQCSICPLNKICLKIGLKQVIVC